jgi:hypothetical protein
MEEKNMIKRKLVNAIMLGLCISALTTGTAFAQSVAGSSPAFSGAAQSEENNAMMEKQKEIDQYLFVDHVKDIEDKGFMVNYTGASDTYVEIGISPYTEENADYLYDIFGKDEVKVVEFDQSIIYATSGPADVAVTDDATVDTAADDSVSKDDEVSIQIESVEEDTAAPDSEEVYTTTSAQENAEVQTVSAAVDTVAATNDTKDTDGGLSAPATVLAIAGGAVIVGGAIILSNKKKENK